MVSSQPGRQGAVSEALLPESLKWPTALSHSFALVSQFAPLFLLAPLS